MRQFLQELLQWQTADGAAIANTTTETVIYPNYTIPKNFLQDGRKLRLTVFFKYSTTGTPTLQLAVRLGGVAGTLIWQTAALTMGSGVTNMIGWMQVEIQVRSNGSSGVVLALGPVIVNTGATASFALATGVAGSSAPATATVDLTVDQDLSVTAKWGTANASNTLTGLSYALEALN